MLEQTKTSLKPFHSIYSLAAKPFKDPANNALALPQKLALSAANLSRAAGREIAGAHGAYWYPLIGVARLWSVPDLKAMVLNSVVTGLAVSLIVTVLMFVVAFAPQFAVLSLIITPFLAFPVTLFVVLAESWFVSYTIAKLTWLEGLQELIFDEIIELEGLKKNKLSTSNELLNAVRRENGAENVDGKSGKSVLKKAHHSTVFSAGKLVGKLRNAPKAAVEDIVEYVVTLPLNLIPGLGTGLFLYVNSETLAARYHARYFELKGWKKDPSKITRFIEEHEPEYRAFGVVALVLNLIPIVNVFFALTNTAGAAVWAFDLEKHGGDNAKATTSKST